MNLAPWLHRLSRRWFGPAAGTRRQPAKCRRVRPCLESLEDRLTPSTTIDVGPTTRDLIAAIDRADHTKGPVVLVLPARTTYTLTAPDHSHAHVEDNNWYGPNGLPAIDNPSGITIEGNGSTIQRFPFPATPKFRLFYVSGGMAGQLPLGSLTLENLTLTGGIAKGGNGWFGGGGDMGAGGAIFNQGTLILNGVTLTHNHALGGSGAAGYWGSGGGMGSDASGRRGGGFGGDFPSGFGGTGGDVNGGVGGFLTVANG
jgi:hypothetical protein